MKSLGLVVAAFLLSATMSFAQGNQNKVSKEPFAANTEKLAKYLELTPAQMQEVTNINEYFIEMQRASLRVGKKKTRQKMQQAVYSNLKLMKETLTPEQYRKYVILLNVTHNNNIRKGITSMPNAYLAAY
ncbi:MAG: hypothetical protein LUG96_07105 [Tannerellaceae bacterium]|nr:hypothetical protein [Tannerellaceae bacterium]